MKQYRRIQRVSVAPLCVLLASGCLASCGVLEQEIFPPIHEALGSIKDTIGPPPPRPRRTVKRAAAPSPAPPRAPQPRAQAAVHQAPDRCHDVPSCETMLRSMTETADRSWISRPETPQGLLTGVRMFAFRTLRPKLTCAELGIALEQLRGVPAALRPPPAGSTPEDIARTTRLAAEVHDELRAENENRCKTAAAPPAKPPAPPPVREPQQPAPAQAPAKDQPAVTTQPTAGKPSVSTEPPAASGPAVTTQPPASPAPGQPKPQVIIPGQPQGQPEKQ
jgi:hypothetical protein